MKAKQFVVLALSGLLFIACNKDDKDEKHVPVQFGSGITAMETKVSGAQENEWDENDRIGVFMVAKGTTTVKDGAANKAYVAKTEGTGVKFSPASADQTLFYPEDNSKVDFIAYYPHTSAIDNYEISLDVADQTEGVAPDLMTAAATNGGAGYDKEQKTTPVEMTFQHRLSKIVLTTTPGSGISEQELEGMNVKITGLCTKAKYNVSTNTLSDPTDPQAILPESRSAGKYYEAILLPQSIPTNAALVFEVDGATYALSLNYTAFQAGVKYNIAVTVSRTSAGLSAGITGWTEETTTGTAY